MMALRFGSPFGALLTVPAFYGLHWVGMRLCVRTIRRKAMACSQGNLEWIHSVVPGTRVERRS